MYYDYDNTEYTKYTDDNWFKILSLWNDFQERTDYNPHPISIKRQAIYYLRKKINRKVTRSDLRRLSAKIKKMKNSADKEEKARGAKLAQELQRVFKCNQ